MKQKKIQEIISPQTFLPNAVYTANETAVILRRNIKAIRLLCRRGEIKSKFFAGGWLITGYSIRAFLENDCALEPSYEKDSQK